MRLLTIFAGAALLVGCASPYSLPSGSPAATLTFDLSSDSTGTTLQGYKVLAYDSPSCAPSKFGTNLQSKSIAGSNERLGPVSVAADTPLTFAVLYGEARMAQNRGCSFTASFLPRAGEAYKVRFAAVDQSMACGMKIWDKTGTEVPFQTPEMSCAVTLAGKVKNGGAGLLNWSVQVTR